MDMTSWKKSASSLFLFLLVSCKDTCFIVFCSNRNLEITRSNGDRLNNGYAGDATNLLRSLINNRQIGISTVDAGRTSPQVRYYRDVQGTTMERTILDCPALGNRNNVSCLENRVIYAWFQFGVVWGNTTEMEKNVWWKFHRFLERKINFFVPL